VTGIGPAAASLDVARRKRGADRVRWLHGDVTSLPPLGVDLVTMTGDVAQVFPTGQEWRQALRAVRETLRHEARLMFESRDPGKKAWLEWKPGPDQPPCRHPERSANSTSIIVQSKYDSGNNY
jgi:hypothetical protein